MRIAHWESHGNGNESKNWEWDGREWELNRWEWEGTGILKAIPAHLYFGPPASIRDRRLLEPNFQKVLRFVVKIFRKCPRRLLEHLSHAPAT